MAGPLKVPCMRATSERATRMPANSAPMTSVSRPRCTGPDSPSSLQRPADHAALRIERDDEQPEPARQDGREERAPPRVGLVAVTRDDTLGSALRSCWFPHSHFFDATEPRQPLDGPLIRIIPRREPLRSPQGRRALVSRPARFDRRARAAGPFMTRRPSEAHASPAARPRRSRRAGASSSLLEDDRIRHPLVALLK
jgi:hypothetical protein